jgi:hypothetical protein
MLLPVCFSMIPIKLPLLALVILFFGDTTSADTQGSVQLYSDGDCTTPNGSSIQAVSGFCIPTSQASSIAAKSFPSCSSGKPVLYISDQTGCNPPSIQPGVQSSNIGDCLSLQTGAGIGSAGFLCVDKVTTVGSQPAVATGKNPSSSSTPDSSTTSDQSSGQNPPIFSGMDLGNRIALGVGLGIGVPGLVLAYLTWRHNIQHHQQQLHQLRDPPPPYSP